MLKVWRLLRVCYRMLRMAALLSYQRTPMLMGM